MQYRARGLQLLQDRYLRRDLYNLHAEACAYVNVCVCIYIYVHALPL